MRPASETVIGEQRIQGRAQARRKKNDHSREHDEQTPNSTASAFSRIPAVNGRVVVERDR